MGEHEEKKESQAHKGKRSYNIYKEDVWEHDPTPGCPACAHAVGPEGAARTGGHTVECRRKFEEIFSKDPARKVAVEAADRRKKSELAEKEETARKRIKSGSTNDSASSASASNNAATAPEVETAAEKREREHDNREVRPGEEEEDEPKVEVENTGRRRRILRLGDREIVLERGANVCGR